MEGRWTIFKWGEFARIKGADTENVPVVPCDDAAIGRAARELAKRFGEELGWVDWGGLTETAFRAAGEARREQEQGPAMAEGDRVMEGRWMIRLDAANGLALTDSWSTGDREVPVVPCDDAAIERAARALCDDEQEAWDALDVMEHTIYRGKAFKALRAAGETP
jgi:hypothetical protein